MQPTQRARLQSVIQAEPSTLIARNVKHPRVPPVTLTHVDVTPDGSQATNSISILGSQGTLSEDPKAQEEMKECLKGLNSAAGYLRRQIASALTIRHIPTLIFREDRGLANANRVYDLLKGISSEDPSDASSSNEKKD